VALTSSAGALSHIPSVPGVGQLLGPEGQSLLIGRPSSLRRWTASHLGQGASRHGERPRTDLSSVARSARYLVTTSAFHQRLVYERLMARHVPISERRDLKPPAYLRLDLGEPHPRLVVQAFEPSNPHLFGPFPSRRSAERTKRSLERRLGLRPCDHVLEPDPASALGLGCLYAQVASCSAPCLSRVSEDGYRELARRAADWLDGSGKREAGEGDEVPALVASVRRPALVVSRRRSRRRGAGRGIELYPFVAGEVLEAQARLGEEETLPEALAEMTWRPSHRGRDDTVWVCAWLGSSPRGAGLVRLRDGEPSEALAERIRRV
jgi:hypothetical protein